MPQAELLVVEEPDERDGVPKHGLNRLRTLGWPVLYSFLSREASVSQVFLPAWVFTDFRIITTISDQSALRSSALWADLDVHHCTVSFLSDVGQRPSGRIGLRGWMGIHVAFGSQ